MTRKTKTVLFTGIILVFICSLFGVLLNRNNTGGRAISQPKNGDDTKSSVLQAYKDFTKTKALQAYKNFLLLAEYENEDSDIMKTHFAISDLNADGTPELLISGDSNMLFPEYYAYNNGIITEIEWSDDAESYPAYGALIPQPSRGTYIYFRGGPGYTDEEDGNNYMPYTLIEYKLENYIMHTVNHAFWQTCKSGDKAGTTEYTLNDKKCSAEEIENQYQLDTENKIELLPNTDINRRKLLSEMPTFEPVP